MKKKHILGIALMAVAFMPLWLSGTAEAKSSYLSNFSSTYPSAPSAIKSCNLCHPGGNTGSLNTFANDFKAAGHIFSTIETKDSDGDGATNLVEINTGTFPGDASSKPATAPPPPAAPTLSSVAISGPASVNENASATFSATAAWSDGSTSAISPAWSENSAYAAIAANGVLTASAVTANQTVTVTASYTSGGVTKTATKSVTIADVPAPPAAVTLSSLTISGPASVNENASATFSATAAWSDGSTSAISPAWSESSAYAAIAANGVLTASAVTANQTVTVTASYTSGGVTKTATKSVTIADVPAPPAAVTLSSLTISGPASVNENGVATFAATATYSDGSSSPATPTWSENSTYTAIDANGVLTASAVTANQTVTVAASYTSGGITKTASKSVSITDVPAPAPAPDPTPVSGQTVFESKCASCHILTGTSVMNLAGDGTKVATSHKAGTLSSDEITALAAFLDAQSAPAPAPPITTGDTDGDGMPDSFEQANSLDYANSGDAQLDADGDGLNNLNEYLRGTNPRNPDSDGDGVWDGADKAPIDARRPMVNTQGRQFYGFWFLDNGNMSWDSGIDTAVTAFGAPLDLPVTGDWNGTGKTKVGTFRQGQWFLDNGNGQWDAGVDTAIASFGAADDVPVTGDWNGDGKTKVGTFRHGAWYLDNGNGQWDGPGVDTVVASFGAADDLPVTGDWNGDGKSQVGTYRQGTWFLDNGNGQWDAGIDKVCHFGTAGDIPVTGDWNGDGKSQIGVYRQGTLYVDANGNGEWDPGIDEVHTGFGAATDIPVSGDWNGDGKSKIGMWR